MKPIKNMAESVNNRLLNIARSDNRPFGELLQYYAMERFLYRLSKSSHIESFILKGALMLRVWNISKFRPTKDIDFLGFTSNDEKNLIIQIVDIISIDTVDDGLLYDKDSIKTEEIIEDADYKGLRVRFICFLGSAKINMQIDIGFGDHVFPDPKKMNFPTILNFPAPILTCYSLETAIAEKFQIMIKRGILNSRMKDFYDIWTLSRQFNFDGILLSKSIKKTLDARDTSLDSNIEAFSVEFAKEKQTQWRAFIKKIKQDHIPESFLDITSGIKSFIEPILNSLCNNEDFNKAWIIPGSWK